MVFESALPRFPTRDGADLTRSGLCAFLLLAFDTVPWNLTARLFRGLASLVHTGLRLVVVGCGEFTAASGSAYAYFWAFARLSGPASNNQ